MPSMRSTFLILFGVFTLLPKVYVVAQTEPQSPATRRFALVVHGGAIGKLADIAEPERRERLESLRVILAAGRKALAEGTSSLDVVEQVVRYLEDDPGFNAGRGAVLNQRGEHELDASIMDGRELRCGAVASVTTVRNPISLARKVMTETRHVLLAGEGAEQFATTMGVAREPLDFFRTPARIEQWQRQRPDPLDGASDGKRLDGPSVNATFAGARGGDHEKPLEWELRDGQSARGLGTVGCVALDQHGNLAAGTSTGGLLNKRFGRIGDSPIIGAGTFADNATCAVSCTGTGEEFIRRAAAFDVSALMAYRRLPLDEAVRIVVADKLPAGSGAMIAVDREGAISVRFNTEGVFCAITDSSGRSEVHLGSPDLAAP